MKMLSIKPEILRFKKFEEFAGEFKIGQGDLVITHEFLFDEFMKSLQLKADFCFQEKYGGEPSDEMIDKISSEFKNAKCKRVFAIGGGSVIDIAKILVLKDVTSTLDVFEKKIPIIKDKELLVVPTTCGTGSEVTNISIAKIVSKETKMGLAVDELYPDYTAIIPELLLGLPFKYFAYSSIDALIHAVEAYVSPKANSFTELFSVKAIEMIIDGYVEIIEKGQEYRSEIIEDFLVASTFAGVAFGNAGVGAVHALSYPLGGKYGVPHGEANYQIFTGVFKIYNQKDPNGKIAKLNQLLADKLGVDNSGDIYDELEELLNNITPKKELRVYGMKEEEIDIFADGVIAGQQRLLANNYVALSRDEIAAIYRKLY
ncbi:MAG: 4-hydroxybutyrate dehydrogenase [Alkaliphilus sp.]